jgi:hypothetical protein
VKKAAVPGYSGKTVAEKLGMKDGTRMFVVNPPADYASLVGPAPGVVSSSRMGANVDIVHLFVTRRIALEGHLQKLRKSLRPNAAVWVSWPKKASRVPTDITEDTIRKIALPIGFVDVKVCAVSDVWSGLKLVVRLSERSRRD